MKRLVYLYPRRWRARYGDEFMALLENCPRRPGVVLDVLRGCGEAHWTAMTSRDWSASAMLRSSAQVLAALFGFVVCYIMLSIAIHFVAVAVISPLMMEPGLHTVAPWVAQLLFGVIPLLLALSVTVVGMLRLRRRLSRKLAVGDA